MIHSKKVLQFFVLTLIAGGVFLGTASIASAAPEFNTNPADPADWFTGQVEGVDDDSDPFSASAGDRLFAGFYYHNNRVGTIAENTRMRIELPSTYEQTIILNGSITADNAVPQTISDTLTINLDSPQKLEFENWAFWYPVENPSDVSYIPIEKYGNYVEAVRGDVTGCFQYRGYVVFPAVVTNHIPAPTVDIKADGSDGPVTIDYGDDVILEWESTNADTCEASGNWGGTKGTSGSEIKYDLTIDKSYVIECIGPGGSAMDNVDILVEDEPTLSVALTADPDSGEEPLEGVDLMAVVSGTAEGDIDYKFDCENDGDWDYNYNALSQETFTVTNACNYSDVGTYVAKVEVKREGLTATDTDIIEVFCNPDITVDLEVDGSDGPVTVNYGDDVTLEWESTDANVCTASGNWSGTKGTSGTEQRYNLTNDKTYHITCTGLGGSATDSVEVLVRDEPVLYVALIADPDHGEEPLENVDLEAIVSGTAEGDIDYKFDCENDGGWDYVKYNVDYEVYTVYDVCDYHESGTYTAKVKVYRDGLTATDTDTITVEEEDHDLGVHLTVDPDHGEEPLENVDLRAVVSGSASGEIDYRFDCDNDGDWDVSKYNTNDEDYTAYNACDYEEAGTYTAKVKVYRDGLIATDTDTIKVETDEEETEFGVDKKVRNKTDGETTWRNSTSASPGDILAYRIIITALDNDGLSNITLEDSLPDKIRWYGNEKINGDDLDHDMDKPLDLDDLDKGDSVEITFEILLQGRSEFGYGATELVNRVSVDADGYSESDSATIVVVKTSIAGATTIPTGALDNFWMSLGITVLSTYALLVIYFFYQRVLGNPCLEIEGRIEALKSKTKARYYAADPFKTKKASEMRLRETIKKIRGREKSTE